MLGQLGTPTPLGFSTTPITVGGLSNAVDVSAGWRHACAVTEPGGGVWCWGHNNHGQVGDGTTMNQFRAVQVLGVDGVVAVSPGDGHTCALRGDGRVWCWGQNDFGQLGVTAGADVAAPVQVDGLAGVTQIAAGRSFTCALLASGGVRCWGRGGSGELGNNFSASSSVPVVTLLPTGTAAVAIAAGASHVCAALQNGVAVCWGSRLDGQLGDGTFNTLPRFTPVAVSGLANVVDLAARGNTTCAALADGTAWCWGFNDLGALGTNDTSDRSVPTAVVGFP